MDYGKKERVGGFDLLKYKNVDGITFIKVSTIMGNWSMEYREGSNLFEFINLEREEARDNALHVMFVNAYMAATMADADYQHELMVAAGNLEERINAGVEPVSDEEDAAILEQLKVEAEMEEHLKDGEEGGEADPSV